MYKTKRNCRVKRFQSVKGQFLTLCFIHTKLFLHITIQNGKYFEYKRTGFLLPFVFIMMVFCFILHILPSHVTITVCFLTVLNIIILCRTIKQENLILISGLGIQLTTSCLLKTNTIFIPLEIIQRIFINEVLFKRRVIYLLTLYIKGKDTKEELIPLFLETLPKLNCLVIIYSSIVEFYNNKRSR